MIFNKLIFTLIKLKSKAAQTLAMQEESQGPAADPLRALNGQTIGIQLVINSATLRGQGGWPATPRPPPPRGLNCLIFIFTWVKYKI